MTAKRNKNPYWAALKKMDWYTDPEKHGPPMIDYNAIIQAALNKTPIPANLNGRDHFVTRYSFAVTDEDTLNFIDEHMDKSKRIVQLHSSNGYWASQLHQLGFDITAFSEESIPSKKFFPVFPGGAEKANEGEILLLVWPQMNSLAYDALKEFRGDTVFYIGEQRHGCTADDAFFTEVDRNWQVENTHPIVRFEGIHDGLYIFKRK